MSHSNCATATRKPHPNFPLTPRGDGRWCKKVRGKFHYFSGTAQEALEERLRVKDDLLAGRTPRSKGDGLTVRDLCNRFLTARQQQLHIGVINHLTWSDYKNTTDRLVAQFELTRLVADLARPAIAAWGRRLTGSPTSRVAGWFGSVMVRRVLKMHNVHNACSDVFDVSSYCERT